jgi:hypothetical protein
VKKTLWFSVLIMLISVMPLLAGTLTTNQGLYKPALGESGSTWWVGMNGNFDTLDGLIKWSTPEKHGAIGDASTNDTVAVQACINSGKKCLLTSRYKISHVTMTDASGTLEGMGQNTGLYSTHVYADGVTDAILWVKKTAHGSTVKNFTIGYITDPSYNQGYVSAASDRVGAIVVGELAATATVDNVTVENMYIKGSLLHGISPNMVKNFKAKNNTIMNATATGIQALWSYDSEYTGNYVYNSRDGGIAVLGSAATQNLYANYSINNIIANNIIVNSQQTGVAIWTCINTTIKGNVIDNTFADPIIVHYPSGTYWNSQNINIEGNIIRNAFANWGTGTIHTTDNRNFLGSGNFAGITAAASDASGSLVISNNQIHIGYVADASPYAGIWVRDGSGSVISNNNIKGYDASPNRVGYGIRVEAIQPLISNNSIEFATTGIGASTSTDAFIIGNRVVNSYYAFYAASAVRIGIKNNQYTVSDASPIILTGSTGVFLDSNDALDGGTCSSGNVVCYQSVATVTLDPSGATSTTVKNVNVTAASLIFLVPESAGAAVPGLTGLYISDRVAATSFKINHPACAGTCTYNYLIRN